MEHQHILDRCVCPGFSVKDHHITYCNQAAQAMLLSPGADVRTLLLTGAEEYAAFQGGCLTLSLDLSSGGWGACVTRVEDQDLFLLDQQPEDASLRSLALAAQQMRNPLSILLLASEALSRCAGDTPETRQQLARLDRGIHQLHRLVNNMSDAAQSHLLTPVGFHDFDRLFHDIFEKVQTQLNGTGITVTYEGPGEPIWGQANQGQLERAILNIVSNALKFLPEDGTIAAKLAHQNNMLHLCITDSGSGIAEGLLGTLFTRYQRQPGIEDSRFGLGLGLVLVRAAAADHGGTVLIDSPNGQGTRITMTLALRQDAPQLRSPVMMPLLDDSRQLLTELSDSLPWECYRK